ncbi:MAG: methyltransferase domain-containing protein [Treponemataceae bacterium]
MNNDTRNTANIGAFNNIDRQQEAEQFIKWLEWIEKLPQSASLRELSYQSLMLTSGETAIDVGCGTGCAVAELTERGVIATGIDASEKMIGIARQRFPILAFQISQAEKLPFEDSSIHGYRAERLYQHLSNPAQALAEARRVLVPGKRIVLVDQDYDAWTIDSYDRTTTRAIIRTLSDSIPQGWIGRQYSALLKDNGFSDVSVEVKTLIYTDYADIAQGLMNFAQTAVKAHSVTQENADRWIEEQKSRSAAGRFFFSLPMFIATALK